MACCEEQGWDATYDDIDGMKKYKGIICLPCQTNKLLDDMMDNFKFREDDVVLVSYPQSNFFWIQEVVYHLLNQETIETPMSEKDALANRVPFLEHEFRNVDPIELLDKMETRRAMKTHFPPAFFTKPLGEHRDAVKTIMWVQDPKDVMVNYHCFWNEKGDYFDFPKLTWEKFYDLFKTRALFEGDWMETHKAWLEDRKGKDNFLMLRYEEAAKDLEGTVRKVAKFLGVKCNGFKASRIAFLLDFDKRREWGDRWTEEQREYMDARYREWMAGTTLEGVYASP